MSWELIAAVVAALGGFALWRRAERRAATAEAKARDAAKSAERTATLRKKEGATAARAEGDRIVLRLEAEAIRRQQDEVEDRAASRSDEILGAKTVHELADILNRKKKP